MSKFKIGDEIISIYSNSNKYKIININLSKL